MKSLNQKDTNRSLFPLMLLIFATPWGVTGEAFGWILASLLMFVMILKNEDAPVLWRDLLHTKWVPILSSICFVLWTCGSTLLNPKNPSPRALTYGLSYFSWILIPVLGHLAYGSLRPREWKTLGTVLAITLGIWGAFATLQYWTSSWTVHGVSVAFESEPRIRGFFGNALTLSYAALVIIPLCFYWILNHPKDPRAWIASWGCVSILVYPESRTTASVAVILLFWSVMLFVHRIGTKRAYLGGILGFFVVLFCFFATNSHLNTRFRSFFDSHSREHYREYPTNRFVFWIVHKEIILERPLLGHGIDLEESYRAPYYDRLGFTDISEKFGAHNSLVQLITNFGFIGLLFFLGWFLWTIWFITKQTGTHPLRHVYWQIFVGQVMGGMTQNNFQDSPVRYVVNLVCLSLWLLKLRDHED